MKIVRVSTLNINIHTHTHTSSRISSNKYTRDQNIPPYGRLVILKQQQQHTKNTNSKNIDSITSTCLSIHFTAEIANKKKHSL